VNSVLWVLPQAVLFLTELKKQRKGKSLNSKAAKKRTATKNTFTGCTILQDQEQPLRKAEQGIGFLPAAKQPL
jgi:hypothetical protein